MANFVPNLSLLLGFLSFFVKLVQGEEYSKFLYPNDPAQVFYYLDTINVTYESSFAAPGLWTFCKDVNVDSYFPKHVDSIPGFNGSYLVKIDWTSVAEACWFNIRGGVAVDSSAGSNSEHFKVLTRAITAGLPTTTTAGPTSLPTTASNPTTTPTAAPAAPSITSIPVAAKIAKEDGGLSAGTKAAIGVTIPLAVIAVLAGVFLYLRRRKAGAAKHSTDLAQGGQSYVEYKAVYGEKPNLVDQVPQELQGNVGSDLLNSGTPAEMDSSQTPALGHDNKLGRH